VEADQEFQEPHQKKWKLHEHHEHEKKKKRYNVDLKKT
jgi:hypothetical protein